jgi:hypothetical protein
MLPLNKRDRTNPIGERSGSDFRPGKILENRHVDAQFAGNAADVVDYGGVLVVSPMGKIQSHDVNAGSEQLAQDKRVARRRTDRRDNLRSFL